jgi:hypothetical protein
MADETLEDQKQKAPIRDPNKGEKKDGGDTKWQRFVSTWPAASSFAIGAVGVGLGAVIMWGLFSPSSIVRQLGNADLARGVITFIFAIGTIGIALLVTLGALIGDHDDTKLGRAKEVLTVLIGIFGTILGFYFGTAANANSQKVEIAEIKIADRQLATHVAGGTPPYRYSITSSGNEFTAIKDQISTDGWIIHQLDAPPKTAKITVEVTDSRDAKGSRDRSLSPDTPTLTASPASTPKGTSPSSPPPTPTATAGTQASPSPTPKS